MAESLKYPDALKLQTLPQTYGGPGADEVAILSQLGRSPGVGGYLAPFLARARNRSEDAAAAIAKQVGDVNAANQQIGQDYLNRNERLAVRDQANTLAGHRKNFPITTLPALRDLIAPGGMEAAGAADMQNLEQAAAETAKTQGEAFNQNATGVKNLDEAGMRVPPGTPFNAQAYLMKFLQGATNEDKKAASAQEVARINAGAHNQGKIIGQFDETTGQVKTGITAPNADKFQELSNQLRASQAPATGNLTGINRAAVTNGKRVIEDTIKKAGAVPIQEPVQQPEKDGVVLRYRVKLQDGSTRDLEYFIGPDGKPKRRGR